MDEASEGGGVAADCFEEGPVSFTSVGAESTEVSAQSRALLEDTSALTKSGSVMHGALCKGVEDNGCSLLSAVIGIVDKDDTE